MKGNYVKSRKSNFVKKKYKYLRESQKHTQTNVKMLKISPDVLILSISMSRTMNVPVLPTPAEQCTHRMF